MSIDWHIIKSIPKHMKDGRPVLLWCGDNGANIGTWSEYVGYADEQPGWEALYECAPIYDVTHYAEIDPPRYG